MGWCGLGRRRPSDFDLAVRFVFGHLRGAGRGSGTGSDRDITDEDWEMLFKTNVLGYARCIKHALPHMRSNKPSDYVIENDQGQGVQRLDCGSRGSIVNVASISSWIAQPEFLPCGWCTHRHGMLCIFAALLLLVRAIPRRHCSATPATPTYYITWHAHGACISDNVSKGAVAQLTRCCAMDFTDERVRVNAVGPGTIDTPGGARDALA